MNIILIRHVWRDTVECCSLRLCGTRNSGTFSFCTVRPKLFCRFYPLSIVSWYYLCGFKFNYCVVSFFDYWHLIWSRWDHKGRSIRMPKQWSARWFKERRSLNSVVNLAIIFYYTQWRNLESAEMVILTDRAATHYFTIPGISRMRAVGKGQWTCETSPVIAEGSETMSAMQRRKYCRSD